MDNNNGDPLELEVKDPDRDRQKLLREQNNLKMVLLVLFVSIFLIQEVSKIIFQQFFLFYQNSNYVSIHISTLLV